MARTYVSCIHLVGRVDAVQLLLVLLRTVMTWTCLVEGVCLASGAGIAHTVRVNSTMGGASF